MAGSVDPIIGFIINGLGRNTLSKGLDRNDWKWRNTGFVYDQCMYISALGSDPVKSHEVFLFDWISAGTLHIPLSFLVDPLSSIMLLIITGVGFLIHIYSMGYMHDDEGFGKFFAYLNLFIFFMLLLVLGSNYIVMFIGWEGVGFMFLPANRLLVHQ